MRRGKKSVVRVAQRVAALVSVQELSSLFSNILIFILLILFSNLITVSGSILHD